MNNIQAKKKLIKYSIKKKEFCLTRKINRRENNLSKKKKRYEKLRRNKPKEKQRRGRARWKREDKVQSGDFVPLENALTSYFRDDEEELWFLFTLNRRRNKSIERDSRSGFHFSFSPYVYLINRDREARGSGSKREK